MQLLPQLGLHLQILSFRCSLTLRVPACCISSAVLFLERNSKLIGGIYRLDGLSPADAFRSKKLRVLSEQKNLYIESAMKRFALCCSYLILFSCMVYAQTVASNELPDLSESQDV